MSVDLPTTERWPARTLAKWFGEIQLGRAIAYLELVRTGKITPGPEIEKLLGNDSCLTWTFEEVDAVQRKLALAICIRNGLGYQISHSINRAVFRHRIEVLASYEEGSRSFGRFNQTRSSRSLGSTRG
jgi:hypothetical protein